MSNKKKLILGVLVGVIVGLVISTTYAIFSYSRTGGNEQLITGDIYMHYKESNTLTLENALPSTTYDSTKYFEFTIDGKNTNTLYDIYYDINLLRGDVPTGKTETNRIQDKFIKFRLTEFVEDDQTHELVETEIFTNKSYRDLSSTKRIHVATIPKNTMSEITHRYRLYMWISNDVVIGNTGNDGIDYDMTTWNNLFASIKVSSTGDFTEKVLVADIPTIESCPDCKFMYYVADPSDITTTKWTTWNNQSQTPTQITSGLYDNYEELIATTGKNYFLGVKLNNNNEVTNAYACGVKDNEPFCIEGTSDGTKYSANSSLINGANLWNNTCTVESNYTECGPWDNSGSVSVDAYSRGDVDAGVGNAAYCDVGMDGYFGCNESLADLPDPSEPGVGGGDQQ